MGRPTQIDWETMFECLEWYQRNMKKHEPQATHEIRAVDVILDMVQPEIDELDWE